MNEAEKKAKEAADLAAKSQAGITDEDLVKSMAALEDVLKSSPEGRQKALFQKGMSGALTDAEKTELQQLMAGGNTKPLSETVAKSIEPASQSEGFQKALNVSDYLDDLHTSMSKALVDVASHVEKSDARTQERIMVLAKGMLDIGRGTLEIHKLLKSFGDRLDGVVRNPARPAKTETPGKPEIPNAPSTPQGMGISKGQALDLLGEMFEKSLAEGNKGLSKGGENLELATANYEQFNEISAGLHKELIEYHRSKYANGKAAR